MSDYQEKHNGEYLYRYSVPKDENFIQELEKTVKDPLLSEGLRQKYILDPSPRIRAGLAQNPSLSFPEMFKLSMDRESVVRASLASSVCVCQYMSEQIDTLEKKVCELKKINENYSLRLAELNERVASLQKDNSEKKSVPKPTQKLPRVPGL